jgi:hypothetical protein
MTHTASVIIHVRNDDLLPTAQLYTPGPLEDDPVARPLCSVKLGLYGGVMLQGSPADLRRLAAVLAEAADKGDALARTVRSILPAVTA